MPIDIEPTVKTDNRNPDLILNAVDLSHLERLFDGLMKRHPMLTDRFLEEIGRAQVVTSWEFPKDAVGIGSRVTYRDETTRQTKSVTLVYPEHADITRLRVSVMTPIGVALLGLR